MSYQVLARKWRPAKFEQVVGQSHVLHALTNALTQNRLHHAYLFSGTRGVGKTSLARLFAKGLNCEQGITSSPCGQCSSCVEIAQGRFVDLIEVDAASRTKVDDTRELLDNVQYRPSRGRFKVYLIDEVHMLSRSSFNALLKTLEEPPEHVKFLLATTDPQRLPVTVLSRCLQFNLKSLTLDEIQAQLANILSQESVSYDEGALKLLAKAANGSMRDALSLTDQAIAFGAGSISLTQVQTMLGTIDEHYVIVLLNALAQGDVAHLLQVTEEVLSFGADPEEVLRSLLELLHQITLTQFAPAAAQLSKYAEQIKAFAEQLNPEQVQLYYQLLLSGRKDLPHAPDPKSGLEMALLRAVAFVPEVPVKRWEAEPNKNGLELPAVNLANESAPLSARPETITDVSVNITAMSSPEMADSSDDKSAAIDKSEDDADVAALEAEQSLILSQAQSQTQGSAHNQGASKEANGPTINVPQPTPAQPQLHESSVVPESIASPISTASSAAVEPVASETAVQTDATTPFGQNVADNAPHFDEMNHFVDDSDSEHYQDPSDYDAYIASQSDIQAASLSPDKTAESVEPSVEVTDPLNDDLLDAVLAARESLLSDLVEQSSKESDTKKFEPKRQTYVPPSRSDSDSDSDSDQASCNTKHENAVQVRDEQQANTTEFAVSSETSATNQHQSSEIAHELAASNDEDRPPWVAAPESNVSTTTSQPTKDEAGESRESSDEPATRQAATSDQTHSLVSSGLSAESEQHRDVVEQPEVADFPAPNTVLPPLDEGKVTGHSIDLQWYRLMSALDIGGRVRQLAVNSVCQQFCDPLPLVLKPNQKHLEAPGAVEQLEAALSQALGDACRVAFAVGVESGRETPLEIRQRFHQELLAEAHHGLLSDDNIQWLQAMMNAEMENDSLSYAPELLGQRGNGIALVDKSNFIESVES
ncbi:DNA polymerase III subunit gamma/tau [Shewanella colwelliana]|uniref:DNA polymerase III subunit gamma/tau n=1 Tax=Shewanella colwelliana TaxID=23 RepID=UPI0022AF884D|nr:DNA polymerase III subunit gamma/tau [Shewanella colwelliana]MCZ4336955.1 DNA polymerase III subunit gamma/tau [Shewanella colwelliana]